MPAKRITAVVGATGAQGGGLVRGIMGDPTDAVVRELTRSEQDSDPA